MGKRRISRDNKSVKWFSNSEFDVLNPTTNLRSTSMFDIYNASVSSGGTASTKVSANPSYGAQTTQVQITEITQLATKDTWNSSSRIKSIVGTTAIDAAQVTTINASIASGFDTIKVTVDGSEEDIVLTGGYDTSTDANARTALQTDLQAQLDAAFGSGTLTVSFDGSNQLQIDGTGHNVTIDEDDASILTDIGLADGDSNSVDITTTLATAFGVADGDMDLTINGVSDFDIQSTDTIQEMMTKINTSTAGVTMSYSELTGKFTMTSNSEGFVNNIELTDTDSFFSTHLKIDGTDRTQGQDVELTIDGVTTSRSSNIFSLNNIEYNIKDTHLITDDPIEIDISTDTTSTVDTIKAFVEKYNDVLGKINAKLNEKKYYDYKPLTADEKASLSEEEIELWEDKAKSGLLQSDSTLQSIANAMRTAIYEPIDGVGISMADIGITTSSNYLDRGKLTIDETKLKEALAQRPNEVVELFTKESATDYDEWTERATRTSENGIASRFA